MNLPSAKHDVRLRRLEEARGDLPALGDDLVGRRPEGGAADHRGAGAHGAHAESDAVGIAVDVPDLGGIDAESLVQDLLEGGLVALALILGAHEHGRAPARGEAYLRELGLGAGGLLDGVDHGPSAEAPALPRGFAAGREARDVRDVEGLVHVLAELAAVVGDAEGGLVRHGGGVDQILPAQLHAVHSELAGGVVDQPLDHEGRLGAARASIGGGGVRVGQHRQHLGVRGREGVDAHEGGHVGKRGEQVAVRGDVGADVGEGPHAEGEKASVRVEGQLGVAHIVAGVLVGGNRLAALAGPLHGSAQPARRPQGEAMLGILPALGAEGAPMSPTMTRIWCSGTWKILLASAFRTRCGYWTSA